MTPQAIGETVAIDLSIVCRRLRRNSVVLEVGTLFGMGSSKIILSSPNVARLYCVEPFFADAPDYDKGREYDNLGKTMRALDEHGKRAVLIVAESIQAAPMFADGSLDMVFIDGDHRYSRASRDIDLWWPKLRRGGMMCGDDMDADDWDEAHIEIDYMEQKHHGVIKAVVEHFAGRYYRSGPFWLVGKEAGFEQFS